jgi:hypothetical protein
MNDCPINCDEQFLIEHAGSISQIGGLKRYILNDGKARGVEAVDVNTGAGLSFTVLPGRGMDIAWASYKGVPLAYMSKTGIVSSGYYENEGMNWLRSFFAGLLTTCGLSNVGNPCQEQHEEVGIINHGLHGRVSNTEAEQVNCTEEWESGKYVLTVSGKMREAMLHGENITLRRTISCNLGDKSFTLRDIVKNEGMYDHHLMLLYHVNLGYPLLDAGSRVIINSKSATTTEGAPSPDQDFRSCHAPVRRAVQRGYSHDLAADQKGFVRLALVNDRLGLGFALEYEKNRLPKFNQWKMLSTGEYVMGLEPGTCLPISREEAERRGEALILHSCERYEAAITFTVLDGSAEIGAFEKSVFSE